MPVVITGDAYFGNYEIQDYWFLCRDTTNDPVYTIRVVINNQTDPTSGGPSGGPYEDFPSWQ